MDDDSSAGATRLATDAPAKLNLFLHVPGRRADGYHRVDSLIAFAEIGDRVSVAPAADLTLSVDGPFAAELPDTGDNLVLRAAAQLRDRTATPSAGATIRLTKNLPVASGIGGGSADAAAVLRALAALWRLDAGGEAVRAIARGLGADVPVCLASRTALVTGIGDETLATPDLPAAALLLVNPGIALPTAAVFTALAAPPLAAAAAALPAAGWDDVADTRALAARLAATRNDLEPPAHALAPTIADILAALRDLPGCLLARMSGSGATCFGLFADADAAAEGAAALTARQPDWWVAASALRRDAPPLERD